jgi:hypothetical protein
MSEQAIGLGQRADAARYQAIVKRSKRRVSAANYYHYSDNNC